MDWCQNAGGGAVGVCVYTGGGAVGVCVYTGGGAVDACVAMHTLEVGLLMHVYLCVHCGRGC